MQTESHEPNDVAAGRVTAFLAAVVVTLVAIGVGTAWLFGIFERGAETTDEPASPFVANRPAPPQPRLQVAPRRELAELRQHEEKVLEGWARPQDDERFVQVPLTRAMEAVASSGLPHWPKVAPVDPDGKTKENP